MAKDESKKSLIVNIWENVEMGIGIVAVSLVVVIAFAQVIARYVLGSSIEWAEEVCKFGIIWMSFGGAAYAFRMGANIGVTFAVDRLPEKIANPLKILTHIIIIACFVLLMFLGAERMIDQIVRNQVSTAARLPMWIPWLSVPVGSALSIARLTEQLITMLKKKPNAEEEGEAK